jgi:AraC-like DNA-binding protein
MAQRKRSVRHPVDLDPPTGLILRKGASPFRDRARYLNNEGIELFEATFERHVYERHIHETYAIGVTLFGVQRFWCRGATRESTPGHVMAIAPGDAHDGESGSAGGYGYRMFYIPLQTLRDIVQDALERRAPDIYADTPLVRDPALAQQWDTTWKAMAGPQPTLAGDELFHRSVMTLAARYSGLHRLRPVAVNSPALKKVRDYLHERVDSAVRVRELAAVASMSRFQLTRQFQQAFGLPLHAYHLHVRLEEAKRRLRSGVAIAHVAADLGFADQSHFHRRFKRWFGVTPHEWRQSFTRT